MHGGGPGLYLSWSAPGGSGCGLVGPGLAWLPLSAIADFSRHPLVIDLELLGESGVTRWNGVDAPAT